MGERSSNYTIGNVMQAFGTVSPKNLNDDKLDSEAYFSNLSLSTVVLQTGRQGGWEQSNITIKDLIVYYQNLFRIPFVIEMVRGDGPRNPPEEQIIYEAETFRRFTEAVAIKALDIV